MREAATLGGVSAHDSPRPRKVAPRTKPSGKGRSGRGVWAGFRRLRPRLALIVGSAGFSAIMIGIVLNATVMQKEHHPAPLFSPAPPARTAAAPVAPPPRPPVVPPAPSLAIPPAAPAVVQPTTPTKVPLKSPVHAASAGRGAKPIDGIARLLGQGPKATGSVALRSLPAPDKATLPRRTPAVPLAARKDRGVGTTAVN